eukprot:5683495-Prorocentrum_lima.AAC.1
MKDDTERGKTVEAIHNKAGDGKEPQSSAIASPHPLLLPHHHRAPSAGCPPLPSPAPASAEKKEA